MGKLLTETEFAGEIRELVEARRFDDAEQKAREAFAAHPRASNILMQCAEPLLGPVLLLDFGETTITVPGRLASAYFATSEKRPSVASNKVSWLLLISNGFPRYGVAIGFGKRSTVSVLRHSLKI